MSSNIDITQPPAGHATTAAVRANFAAAKTEIEALQAAVILPKTADIASPGAHLDLVPGADDLIIFTASTDTTLDILPGTEGKSLLLRITQDATGGHAITLGSTIAAGASLPAWQASTGANKTDYLALRYDVSAAKWHLLAYNNGF
jgi:hypothetical protein